MLPSAAELEYFQEVSHSLNLSRAAERLGISQPSLSLAIRRLEQTMGATLLIRHKHGVSLTQAGKQLLLHVRQLLQFWESTKSKALASQEEIQGRFIVGCNSVIAIYRVASFLPDLLEKHPRLEINLQHDLSQKITEQVINLSIDIGIVINPVKHPDLIIRKLGYDETGFWIGSGNRKIQDPYSENAVVVCNPNSIQAQALLLQCKKVGIHFKRVVTTESMEVVANLTANGCGIGIIPARVAKSLHPRKLKPIPKLPNYSDELCLIYRNENRSIKAIQAIVTAIKEFHD
jgi:DNA-binding transcriptional LysR family regulator